MALPGDGTDHLIRNFAAAGLDRPPDQVVAGADHLRDRTAQRARSRSPTRARPRLVLQCKRSGSAPRGQRPSLAIKATAPPPHRRKAHDLRAGARPKAQLRTPRVAIATRPNGLVQPTGLCERPERLQARRCPSRRLRVPPTPRPSWHHDDPRACAARFAFATGSGSAAAPPILHYPAPQIHRWHPRLSAPSCARDRSRPISWSIWPSWLR